MKNKYIIMIYDLCIDILKKEDDKLLLIKENIQSKLSYDSTLSNQIILDDSSKIIHPTFTYYYFQENKTSNFNISYFITKNIVILIDKCIDIINKNDSNKKEFIVYNATNTVVYYTFINDLNINYLKGYSNFAAEIQSLFNLFNEKREVVIITDLFITSAFSGDYNLDSLVNIKNLVETKLRSEYLFLSNYPNDIVNQIINSIIIETIKDNRQNQFIYQDNIINLSDDDFSQIEQFFLNDITNKLKEKTNCLFLNLIKQKRMNNLLKSTLKNYTFINFQKLLIPLYDYHKINNSFNETLLPRLSKNYKDKLLFINLSNTKNNDFLKNTEKTEFIKRLKRLIEMNKDLLQETTK